MRRKIGFSAVILIAAAVLLSLLAASTGRDFPQAVGKATRTPIPAGVEPPPKGQPGGGGRKARDDGGGRDDGPAPRPQPPNPVSDLDFHYTVSGSRVDVRLENAGPDDAGGICLKVWGSIESAWVEWGDATVRPGGADLCWHRLYHDNGTAGCFTVADGDLESYAELHWNGGYRVVSVGLEGGEVARALEGEVGPTSQIARLRPVRAPQGEVGPTSQIARLRYRAAPLFAARLEREPHVVQLSWRDTFNAVELPGGAFAGRAYDTALWSAGREAVEAIAPPLVVEGKAVGAIPVRGSGFIALCVATKINGGLDTGLAVYRIGDGDTAWGLAHEEVFSGTYSLQQNDDGPVLVGDGVFYQVRVLDDGTVTVGEAAPPVAHWVHRLGDGTVVDAPGFEGLLGVRYDEAINNYVFALGEHVLAVEGPPAGEEPPPAEEPAAGEEPPAGGEEPPPGESPATIATVGTAPAIYLDALLVSGVVERVGGMELAAITVEGAFYCAGGGPCTRAEIVAEGGGIAVPLVVEGPGTYPLKGGIDEDLVVSAHIYPIDGATPSIEAVYLRFERIELPQIVREEPLDLDAGMVYEQFDVVHPRRLEGNGLLHTGAVEMPAPQAKLRRVFLDAEMYGALNVFALSADDPPQVLAFKKVEEAGWFSLTGGVYGPFRLAITVPGDSGGATVHGLAVKLTWQGIY